MAWHFPVRYRKNYCIEEKRTPSLRGDVLEADTTGPAVSSRCKTRAAAAVTTPVQNGSYRGGSTLYLYQY